MMSAAKARDVPDIAADIDRRTATALEITAAMPYRLALAQIAGRAGVYSPDSKLFSAASPSTQLKCTIQALREIAEIADGALAQEAIWS